MATPHNSAKKGDIAKTVLMPGDPLRAKFMAEKFLDNPVQFNSVRGMLGFTGTYKSKPVSIMGSGMGIPSIGIYSWELFTEYDVDNIIRVGSAGGCAESLKLFDVILATEAFSESTYAKVQGGFEGDTIKASVGLMDQLRASANAAGVPLVEGRSYSGDVFYYSKGMEHARDLCLEHNCVAVEMESFALFHNASMTGKNAACLLTISDMLTSTNTEITTPEQRETGFTRMVEVALGIL